MLYFHEPNPYLTNKEQILQFEFFFKLLFLVKKSINLFKYVVSQQVTVSAEPLRMDSRDQAQSRKSDGTDRWQSHVQHF